MPSPRKLKLVAMHMPEWEEVGRTLGIEQDVLDRCKKSNRLVVHLNCVGEHSPHAVRVVSLVSSHSAVAHKWY